MQSPKIEMSLLSDEYTIHRFEPNVCIPLEKLNNEAMFHISKTDEELSVVCRSIIDLDSDKEGKPYNCLKVLGPLDFSLVGIISRISGILKKGDIPIFVISTFDTDYILINKANVSASIKLLSEDEYISITNVPN